MPKFNVTIDITTRIAVDGITAHNAADATHQAKKLLTKAPEYGRKTIIEHFIPTKIIENFDCQAGLNVHNDGFPCKPNNFEVRQLDDKENCIQISYFDSDIVMVGTCW